MLEAQDTYKCLYMFQEGIGSKLRRLLEALDGDVQHIYEAAGLSFRPRFHPLVRVLLTCEPTTLRALSRTTGVSHSAVSQTIAEMVRAGLVQVQPSQLDRREREVRLTREGRELVRRCEPVWAAVSAAVEELDGALPQPLSETLDAVLASLAVQPFQRRIAHHLQQEPPPCCDGSSP